MIPAAVTSDAGYLYNRARQLMAAGRPGEAAQLLANRGAMAALPLDAEKWVGLQLSAARSADGATAVLLASKIDDAFAPGADISAASFRLRDDYTSLMWLGGTKALWSLGNPRGAAPLFWRYGNSARTPQTRSKGFYWAGRALAQAGDGAAAAQYFQQAATYPDQFYGQLALERLGRPIPQFAAAPSVAPTPAQRQAFLSRPIAAAVREVARDADWPVAVRFFKEIANQAATPADHQIVADFARELGRRDLGVILGQAAGADGIQDFQHVAFPLIPTPDGTNWTMVHAISRQESQFAENAVSHAGARGLMQLMPGTAREQAGKVGLSYDASALMAEPGYNLKLGDGYFGRMMSYYNGSYPLAVAAYNAGPGNVNKWLRANGDPRTGAVDWIDWVERIPISETRNYVQRVLENAVVYEAMNPAKASYRGANPLSHFLGKAGTG
jgi:soluble lytic murein transglycosylase